MKIVAKRPTQDILNDARSYLDSTDWYCARKVDEGTEIPADVVAARAAARETIRALS